MSLNPASFRRAAFALAAVSGFALGGAAHAQPPLKSSPVKGTPMQTVSPAECSTFADYVSDEAEAFPGKLSATFMNSVFRFVKAKCTARDAQGEIQLITMNDQDGASLGTA